MATTKKKTTKAQASKFSKETYLQWFELMLLIRRFEERANLIYATQRKIRGFLHLCIGQEAVYAAMQTATRDSDAWITAYRQHGAGIAKGISPRAAMAELYGKATGNVKGKGGSMHFFHAEKKYFGGHGIVGGQIGLGAGIALSEQYKGTDNVCFTLFGDGAARQGMLHETFNMAMTWKLPVVFICENNKYAMGTSVERTSNVTEMHKQALSYEMPSEPVDGMDPELIHEALERAAEHARSGKGPYYLEINTYRYRGHSMSDPSKYRTKEEVKEYQGRDPIEVVRQRILDRGFATEAELEAIDERVDEQIEDCTKFADESPYPEVSELYTDNYTQEDYPFIQE